MAQSYSSDIGLVMRGWAAGLHSAEAVVRILCGEHQSAADTAADQLHYICMKKETGDEEDKTKGGKDERRIGFV